MSNWNLIAAAGIMASTANAALADVYTYVGHDSVTVLTNSKPQNQEARVLVAEPVPTLPRNTPSTGAGGQPPRSRFNDMIETAASAAGVDGALLHAVIAVESGYDVHALSKRGAAGLMQLMPATAREFGTADVFDAAQNINGGARYLRYLLDKYDQRLDIVLAAYNAGEKALLKYGRTIPPFKETIRYVEQVQRRYQRYSGPDPGKDAPAPLLEH